MNVRLEEGDVHALSARIQETEQSFVFSVMLKEKNVSVSMSKACLVLYLHKQRHHTPTYLHLQLDGSWCLSAEVTGYDLVVHGFKTDDNEWENLPLRDPLVELAQVKA